MRALQELKQYLLWNVSLYQLHPDAHMETIMYITFGLVALGILIGILSVTEIIFDPHFQSKGTVLRLARAVGFQEKNIFGNRFAFTMQLEKPADAQQIYTPPRAQNLKLCPRGGIAEVYKLGKIWLSYRH